MQVDVTPVTSNDQQRRDRMIAAFARTASSIAWQGSLQTVLDQLADEARTASGADMCTVSLRSRLGETFIMVGASGCPEEYKERLQQARSLGAPLATEKVYKTGALFVANIGAMLEDARFAPLVKLARRARWRTLVAVPLSVRDVTVGALTAFYTPENEPDQSDMSFLAAMAEHGALAVHTARLLAQAKDKAALEERAHMARDLHDAISQQLFSMQLRVRALQLEADRSDRDTAQLAGGLKELNQLIRSAVEEMRALILHLRPPQLREHALAPALERLADTIRSREKVDITVDVPRDMPPLAAPYDEHIYRIAQEAIGNAVNHAKAERITVKLAASTGATGEILSVEIADDGVGFDPDQPKPGHVGLENMRARCGELGGQLTIDSSPRGTRVRIRVPLDQSLDR
jgi:signal transduction histidine kinase